MQEQPRYRLLRVVLTDEEIQRKGEELARLEMEAEQVKSDASAAAKGFKGQLEGLTTMIKALSRDVNAKSEWRDVEVKDWTLPEEGIVITRRCDTFDEISRRAMTAEERQAKLPFDADEIVDGVLDNAAAAAVSGAQEGDANTVTMSSKGRKVTLTDEEFKAAAKGRRGRKGNGAATNP